MNKVVVLNISKFQVFQVFNVQRKLFYKNANLLFNLMPQLAKIFLFNHLFLFLSVIKVK